MTFFSPTNWELIHEQSLTDIVTKVVGSFNGNPLLVKTMLVEAPATWTKAAEVTQAVDLSPLGEWTPDKKYEILWLNQLTLIKPLKLDTYDGFRLKIERVRWINLLDIQIYQSLENMPQIYNEPATSLAASAISSATVAASTTSISLIAANASRKWIKIINTSATADLYIDYDGAASLLDYAEKIPRGGNNAIVISGEEWRGAIAGIWSTANGAAMIREAT